MFRENLALGSVPQPQSGGWRVASAVLDSGAEESVAPKGWFPVPVRETSRSRAGVTYRAANGTRIPNLGQQDVTFRNGQEACTLSFQVAPVSRPLIPVSQLLRTGNRVNFSPDQCYIEHVASGRRMPLRKAGGVYVLDMQVRDPAVGSEPVFSRHG